LYRVGDRIGQLVVERVHRVSWNDTTVLSETTRGTDGYGSTGQN
jgi:dUTP pyrophosphatase